MAISLGRSRQEKPRTVPAWASFSSICDTSRVASLSAAPFFKLKETWLRKKSGVSDLQRVVLVLWFGHGDQGRNGVKAGARRRTAGRREKMLIQTRRILQYAEPPP